MEVFRALDEVRLPDDHVQMVRVFELDLDDLHGSPARGRVRCVLKGFAAPDGAASKNRTRPGEHYYNGAPIPAEVLGVVAWRNRRHPRPRSRRLRRARACGSASWSS